MLMLCLASNTRFYPLDLKLNEIRPYPFVRQPLTTLAAAREYPVSSNQAIRIYAAASVVNGCRTKGYSQYVKNSNMQI
jgi:hypothetical protein